MFFRGCRCLTAEEKHLLKQLVARTISENSREIKSVKDRLWNTRPIQGETDEAYERVRGQAYDDKRFGINVRKKEMDDADKMLKDLERIPTCSALQTKVI
jgi:hypothetical protein